MKERPILFSGPMVRALLDGSKTQTRRVLKQAVGPSLSVDCDDQGIAELSWLYGDGPGHDVNERTKRVSCPYGVPGDRLWVRETFQGPMWEESTWDPDTDYHKPEFCEYRADGGPVPEYVDFEDNLHQGWKPSIHMPRWASRITLEVTGVRVERLNDISDADAGAEGWPGFTDDNTLDSMAWFSDLWDSLGAARGIGWDANPWVWVVEFKRIVSAAA
jgi:hypothetical protein